MKTKIIIGLFLLIILGSSRIYAQEQAITLTANSRNIVGGWCAKIDNPSLNDNPNAILIAEPQTAGYSQPVAVWYRQNSWHVCNTNQTSIPVRSQFQIRFWTAPGQNQFVHKVTRENLRSDGSRIRIDHPALNARPRASWGVYQSISNERNDGLTANIAKGEYVESEKKWFLVNEGLKPFSIGNSFNIVIFDSGTPDLVQSDLGNTSVKPATGGNDAANNSATAGTGIKTFFKTDSSINSFPLPKNLTQTNSLPSLEQTISVAKKSRLIIDASVLIGSLANQSSGGLRVKINGNVENLSYSAFSLAPSTSVTVIINSFMTDVNPGTYRIEFEIIKGNSSDFQSLPIRSSVILIPIE